MQAFAFALETEAEIEEHVAELNRFFRETRFTLDDLDTYAGPFGAVVRAVYSLSEGTVTEEQAVNTLKQAASDLKALHAEMDRANDQEQAQQAL